MAYPEHRSSLVPLLTWVRKLRAEAQRIRKRTTANLDNPAQELQKAVLLREVDVTRRVRTKKVIH